MARRENRKVVGCRMALALACILVCGGGCGSQVDGPGEWATVSNEAMASFEGLARLAFDALKADDPSLFLSTCPIAEDLEWALERFRDAKGEEMYRKLMTEVEQGGGIAKKVREVREENLERFRKVRGASAEAFDWRTASYGGLDAERTKEKEKDVLQTANIYFLVDAGGKRWLFKIDDCGRTNRGWVSGDGLRFRGVYEAEEPDAK